MATSLNIKHGTGKILTEQDIEILQKSSILNEEEIRKTHAEFWEEFPDGKMTKEAFINYSQLISNNGQEPGKVCDDAFSVFDQNHDGVIDFPEFLFMLACDSNSDLVKKYGEMFQMCDASGNGQIDKNELIGIVENARRKLVKTPEPDDKDTPTVVSITFNLLGVEENETVNKEQFIIGCIKYPILTALFGDNNEEEEEESS